VFAFVLTRRNGRPMNNKFRNNRQNKLTMINGFTLVEILLVLLITSVLVLGLNAVFRQVNMLCLKIEKERPCYQNSRLLIDSMRAELACLYLPKIEQEQQLKPFALSSSEDAIKIDYFTLNPAWKNSAVSNFPARVSYELNKYSDAGQNVLSRTEQWYSGQIPIGLERKESIFTDLSDFRIQAADPASNSESDPWKDNIQCEQLPPKAIKVHLVWPTYDHNKLVFDAAIKITCQGIATP
jgi:prepilin-type N-terminal cleavage/methylation domain-containing protein